MCVIFSQRRNEAAIVGLVEAVVISLGMTTALLFCDEQMEDVVDFVEDKEYGYDRVIAGIVYFHGYDAKDKVADVARPVFPAVVV